MSRALVWAATALVAIGLIRLSIAFVGNEGGDERNLRPHDLLALVLFALGAYALLAAHYVRSGRHRRLAIPTGLALISVSSVALMYFTAPGGLVTPDRDERGLVDGLVYLGLLLTVYAAMAVLVVLPATYALGWLADQVPALRRRGVGTAIRRWPMGRDGR